MICFFQSCDANIATPTDLIQHMKSHGLKLYQCTWCVHGADNESEMLNHVSIAHPNKLPQAYLRIITNKVRNFVNIVLLCPTDPSLLRTLVI